MAFVPKENLKPSAGRDVKLWVLITLMGKALLHRKCRSVEIPQYRSLLFSLLTDISPQP